MLTRSGAWHVMECQGNAVWDERQGAQLVVLILRDIEARVRSDVELQLAAGMQASSEGSPLPRDVTEESTPAAVRDAP
jgi:hypothetical protein